MLTEAVDVRFAEPALGQSHPIGCRWYVIKNDFQKIGDNAIGCPPKCFIAHSVIMDIAWKVTCIEPSLLNPLLLCDIDERSKSAVTIGIQQVVK